MSYYLQHKDEKDGCFLYRYYSIAYAPAPFGGEGWRKGGTLSIKRVSKKRKKQNEKKFRGHRGSAYRFFARFFFGTSFAMDMRSMM